MQSFVGNSIAKYDKLLMNTEKCMRIPKNRLPSA